MKEILVVGGSGFLGVHVARRLVKAGYRVWATHSPRTAPAQQEGVTWLTTELTSAQVALNWPAKCDAVLFLAQARNWRRFPECAGEVFAVNLAALHQTVRYALQCGAGRLVVASTGSVYPGSTEPMCETDVIDSNTPRNFYAASKLAAEILLAPYAKLLPIVQCRIFVPYGPGMGSDVLLSQLVNRVRYGQPITLQGDDGMRINPIWAGDVAEAFQRCLGLESSATLNVAGPAEWTLRGIGATIGRVLGIEPRFEVQAGTPPRLVGDVSHLQSVLGWAPGVSLLDGLRVWLQELPARQAA